MGAIDPAILAAVPMFRDHRLLKRAAITSPRLLIFPLCSPPPPANCGPHPEVMFGVGILMEHSVPGVLNVGLNHRGARMAMICVACTAIPDAFPRTGVRIRRLVAHFWSSSVRVGRDIARNV